MLPDPSDQPTIDASAISIAYGIGVNAARREGQRFIETAGAEGIPCMRYGRLLRFPTAAVRQHLGIDPRPDAVHPQRRLPAPPSRTDDTGAPRGSAAPTPITPRRSRSQ